MAVPKCLGCGSTRFERREFDPHDSATALHSIQCMQCGGVVGVLPATSPNMLIRQLAEKLGFKLK